MQKLDSWEIRLLLMRRIHPNPTKRSSGKNGPRRAMMNASSTRLHTLTAAANLFGMFIHFSDESTKSSSIRTNYIQGVQVNREKLAQTSSSGKPPTYTLQKAARMTARVNTRWVRIASVIAYLLAISAVAFVLVLYYQFFYDPYRELHSNNLPEAFLEPESQKNAAALVDNSNDGVFSQFG